MQDGACSRLSVCFLVSHHGKVRMLPLLMMNPIEKSLVDGVKG